MIGKKFNIIDLSQEKTRLLHFSWLAFFITFFAWFNHAPLLSYIKDSLLLTDVQIKVLLILNVALTIPSRIITGMLVDKFGPRLIYSVLLFSCGLLCYLFALSQSYEQLAITRFLMGFIGAGFVIGIRLVSEWFPAKEVGVAEGIYGGWGNFGSAAAAMTLPTLTFYIGGENGWRWSIAMVGTISIFYAIIFYIKVRNTPEGSVYYKPTYSRGLEVSSRKDYYMYIIMNIPMYLALAILNWRLGPSQLNFYSELTSLIIYLILVVVAFYQFKNIALVNRERIKTKVPEFDTYRFSQVALLSFTYMVTFGSELAVVSMLPLFIMDTFSMSAVWAGIIASSFAFMNLVARPSGGLLSDRFGRKKSLSIFISGLSIGYLILSQLDHHWPIAITVLAISTCSFFVQAGEGAVFAMVPLIKRRMTGQIAGMVGAYGNVGAVIFLTTLSFVNTSTFFLVLASIGFVNIILVQYLNEPKGHMAELDESGKVNFIEVS